MTTDPRRVVVAVLGRPEWVPAGLDAKAWRLALAEDLLDVLATVALAHVAIAVEADSLDLPAQIGWPGIPVYEVATLDVGTLAAAASADGYQHVVLLAGDAPDLPGMLIAKLLRPLTSKPVAVAAATGATTGLVGLALTLPGPAWLPAGTLDTLTPWSLRGLAPTATEVAAAPGWHRLRTPQDLRRLDPGLPGWDCTRAILAASL